MAKLVKVLKHLERARAELELYYQEKGKNRINDVIEPLVGKAIVATQNTISAEKAGHKWAL